MSTSVHTFPDSAALVTAVGERLAQEIESVVRFRGKATIVLTGGGTGIGVLSHLGEHSSGLNWSRVHLFWGDDRFVPEDDDERNFRQARIALLDRIDIPADNVHPMAASDGEFGSDIQAAATAYERELAAVAEKGEPAPHFDVHLLGMGPEGHINSLFPDTDAVREKTRMVVAVENSPKPPPRRITLTLPAIQRSREVWLIVSGAGKADAVAAAINGADPTEVPAAGALGRDATVWWLDEPAAEKL